MRDERFLLRFVVRTVLRFVQLKEVELTQELNLQKHGQNFLVGRVEHLVSNILASFLIRRQFLSLQLLDGRNRVNLSHRSILECADDAIDMNLDWFFVQFVKLLKLSLLNCIGHRFHLVLGYQVRAIQHQLLLLRQIAPELLRFINDN